MVSRVGIIDIGRFQAKSLHAALCVEVIRTVLCSGYQVQLTGRNDQTALSVSGKLSRSRLYRIDSIFKIRKPCVEIL